MEPIGVNWDHYRSNDHYFKGALVIHTLRNVIDNDAKLFRILRSFYEKYKHKTCTTVDFVNHFQVLSGIDLSAFFKQYLWYPGYPSLDYELLQKGTDLNVNFRWTADVRGFRMPLKIGKPGAYVVIHPETGKAKSTTLRNFKKSEFIVATELLYIRKNETKFSAAREGLFPDT
jgi:aminopeptidase N